MPDVTVLPLVDPGLGNSAYLVDLGDGRALAVDASRDLRTLREAAARAGLAVAYAADTHLHADFLSGSRQLAAADGAVVIASAAGGRPYSDLPLDDGDEVDLGGLRLQALATPGHTDEHLSFLLLDGDVPLGVFSGGSLIVGAAARPDLLGAARTEELARAQYASVRRLAQLPDHVALWPTHGAGSFCSAPPGAERVSTIGAEKAANSLVAAPDEDSFVAALLGSLGSYPAYFSWLAEVNRTGPAVLAVEPALAHVPAGTARRLLDDGVLLVDTRPVPAFAAGHVAGSLSVPLRDAFATWLGWLVPRDQRVLFLRGDEQDPAEIAWQAAKVGYDGSVVGELARGWEAAVGSGMRVSTTSLLRPHDVPGTGQPLILDVRQRSEHAAGHIPGARNVELAELAAMPPPTGPVVVACGHGERATTAASLLERSGTRDVAIMVGGPNEWAAAHGVSLEVDA